MCDRRRRFFWEKLSAAIAGARGAREDFVPTIENIDLVSPGWHQPDAGRFQTDLIIHLAAQVGGIGANREHPAEFFYNNLMMGVQLMHRAWQTGVGKFVAIGTICAYPKFTPIPFDEDNLWNGYPEETKRALRAG
jgi:GDP-L-fucose synthase